MTDKMKLTSMDIAAERRAELKTLFPSIFTETKDEKGKLVESIDFEKLKAELGTFSDVFEARRERFGMDWPGKKDCLKLIQIPSHGTLAPCRNESVDFDKSNNVFVEGDNLEVLKLLQKSYYGKVKLIYIDPPYNTGAEFIYPDDYSESLDTYLLFAGLTDESGKRFSTNTATGGRFHTRWLNMMWPRLYLARNLLSDDGVIFISIDDHEVNNLRRICDEIFGEEQFLGHIVRSTGQTTGQDGGGLGSSFDFILAYSKNGDIDLSGLPLTPKDRKRFDNEDSRGKFALDQMRKTGGADRREDRPNMFYAVLDPDGNEVFPIAPAGYEGRWRFEKKSYERLLAEEMIVWKKTTRFEKEVWWPYVKYYLEGRTKRPSPLWTDLDGNKKASRDLREIFDGKKVFDFPKPVELIKRCIQIAPNASADDLILDFFAGAGVTGEAVYQLNAEDGGNRRFILVQLPEECESGTDAAAAGLLTIADLCKERLRRCGKGQVQDDSLLNSDDADSGFRVFKLARSNFLVWHGNKADADEKELTRQLELHIDHVSENASPEDLLFELLLKAGFQPTERVEQVELAGINVYSIADSSLLICLEDEVTRELIDAVAEKEPMQFICLDKAFKGNDQLKANAVQTFAARNQGREKAEQIIFRTV